MRGDVQSLRIRESSPCDCPGKPVMAQITGLRLLHGHHVMSLQWPRLVEVEHSCDRSSQKRKNRLLFLTRMAAQPVVFEVVAYVQYLR